jgi:hypothetical protein
MADSISVGYGFVITDDGIVWQDLVDFSSGTEMLD